MKVAREWAWVRREWKMTVIDEIDAAGKSLPVCGCLIVQRGARGCERVHQLVYGGGSAVKTAEVS